ncbi:MAG: methionyl-tRNA formyltransferase [Candidatus Omnitrophica bacterium]|nr:methionyl-tRNA formyltransferase [Candidatus Omnitrophota bacterium]
MKIVFFGSSSFAVASLQLLKTEHEIAAVFTQPDRSKGRHLHIAKTPVKICAEYNKIEVFQPERISDEQVVAMLKKFQADIFVVVSFGQKLSREVLDIPRLYCVNVHASLLPRYRGAAPINHAIMNGDKITGVSIIKMNEFMDGGDIILSKSLEIGDDDAIMLTEKLGKLGALGLLEAMEIIEKGKVEFIKQEQAQATKANKLKKADGCINWQDSAESLRNKVRGLLPWPCAYTYYKGKFLKVLKSKVIDYPRERPQFVKPAEVISVCAQEGIVIACGRGELKLERVQPEGKRAMDAHAFVLGHHIKTGESLG